MRTLIYRSVTEKVANEDICITEEFTGLISWIRNQASQSYTMTIKEKRENEFNDGTQNVNKHFYLMGLIT